MEVCDKVLECKLIVKLHSSLETDPVIAKYIELTEFSQNEDYVPRYSDKCLRSALFAIHESSAHNKTTLDLYRRLIAFYYSTTFYTVNTLAEVMQIFTKKEIVQIFNDVDNILNCWDKFLRSTLLPLFFKETFLEVMKEWAKRLEFVYVSHLEDVEEQARKVLTYLYWDHKYMQPWLETFNSTDLPNAQYQYTTEQQLDIKVIIHDIRDSLNPLIHKYVLNNLPLDIADKPPALPLFTTNPQEVHTCDEITIKEECIEPTVTHSIESDLNIDSDVHNETQRYDESFSGDDTYFHQYDNSITALSGTKNELFVINEFDMSEEVNTCYDSKGKMGIKKATALRYLDELRQYALQTGLVQIIEKLNEIGSLISRTRAKSSTDRSREYRQRIKQRQNPELNSRSLSTIAAGIPPSTGRSISSSPTENTLKTASAENSRKIKKKLQNSDFPTTTTSVPLSNDTNTMQYNNQVDQSVQSFDESQSAVGLTLYKNGYMPQNVFDVRSSSNDANSSTSIPKKKKTSAERTRQWRARKGHFPKPVHDRPKPKTTAVRSREYRERKKNKGQQPNTDTSQRRTKSSADRSREYRQRIKQRQHPELYLREEYATAGVSHSLSTIAAGIRQSDQ